MRDKTKSLTMTALMSAVICLLGPFVIPFGIVPLNFAGIGIYLASFLLGGKRGMIAVLLYLLIGLTGIPVFSGFTSGPGRLFGATGGYLLSYVPSAYLTGILYEKVHRTEGRRKSFLIFISYFFISTVGNLLLYLCGSLWLAFVMKMSFAAAVQIGVVPFLITDSIKNIITILLGTRIKKGMEKFF